MVAPCAPAAYSVRREKLRRCPAAGEVLNALPIKAGLTLGEYAKLKSSATEVLKRTQSSWHKPRWEVHHTLDSPNQVAHRASGKGRDGLVLQ